MRVKSVDRSLLTAGNLTITVDGTSCAKKTTILAATGRPVYKVQRYNNAHNANTFGASMVGYVTAGMLDVTNSPGAPKFCDRSPLNVIEWHVLWKLMDEYVRRFGNVRPDGSSPGVERYMREFRDTFDNLKRWYVYRHFRSRLNAVAIVDTDVARCDRLRAARGAGSDAERASWLFYTPLQNLMYAQLYPGAFIDLNDFAGATDDAVVAGVAGFLNDLLAGLRCAPDVDQPRPLRLTPPVVFAGGLDFTMHNMRTHVYRSLGRAGVRTIYDRRADFLPTGVPAYVQVRSAYGPGGEPWRKDAVGVLAATPQSRCCDGNGGGCAADTTTDAAADDGVEDDTTAAAVVVEQLPPPPPPPVVLGRIIGTVYALDNLPTTVYHDDTTIKNTSTPSESSESSYTDTLSPPTTPLRPTMPAADDDDDDDDEEE